MALPGKRRSRSKLRRTRAHQALKAPQLTACPSCKQMIKPHVVCPFCGQYKGQSIIKGVS